MTVLGAGSRDLIVTHPDEVLQEAVVKMLRADIGRLPVVDRNDPRRLVGYLGRPGVWRRVSGNTRKSTCANRGYRLSPHELKPFHRTRGRFPDGSDCGGSRFDGESLTRDNAF